MSNLPLIFLVWVRLTRQLQHCFSLIDIRPRLGQSRVPQYLANPACFSDPQPVRFEWEAKQPLIPGRLRTAESRQLRIPTFLYDCEEAHHLVLAHKRMRIARLAVR